jgi:hypothetical protein
MIMASAFYRDLLQKRQDAGYELFPVGAYDAKVVDVEKSQKMFGFIVQFEVTSGPFAGRKFKNWMTLSDSVIETYPGLLAIWFKEMAAMGLGDDFFKSEPGDDQVINALKGRTARVTVGRRKKKNSDDEVEDIRVSPPTTQQATVTTAADPMAMTAAPATATAAAAPAADPNAPGLPPF